MDDDAMGCMILICGWVSSSSVIIYIYFIFICCCLLLVLLLGLFWPCVIILVRTNIKKIDDLIILHS